MKLADGKVPALCCFERPGVAGSWCHRALVKWYSRELGLHVPELGYETAQVHPLMRSL
jgi:hypothetical protein